MGEQDRRVGVYIGKSERWERELTALRAILNELPVDETLKWRQPAYTHGGANIVLLWAMKDCCGLSFLKGVLLTDPAGLLVQPGENSRSARMMKFTDVAGIEAAAEAIRGFVREMIELEKAGAKVDLPKDDFDLPEELSARLADDPELSAAWDALTPGRRRGWALHFDQPKKAETRVSRIDKAAPLILAGKGMHDR